MIRRLFNYLKDKASGLYVPTRRNISAAPAQNTPLGVAGTASAMLSLKQAAMDARREMLAKRSARRKEYIERNLQVKTRQVARRRIFREAFLALGRDFDLRYRRRNLARALARKRWQGSRGCLGVALQPAPQVGPALPETAVAA